jgi:protocatechuate 3,4-dioxygenase, alpha subunit
MNETPSQTIGPFFRHALDWMDADLVAPGEPGAVELWGVVVDAVGPVPDAVVELWQPPSFARAFTDDEGRYRCWVGKAASAPPGTAPHIDVSVFARGLLQRLVTRVYFPDESAANEQDGMLALVPEVRRNTLVACVDGPARLRFDIRLQGASETVFFAY